MRTLALLIVITALIFPQNRWTKLNGPGGGVIAGLYTKGDTILAGTGYSKALIFYSTNSGKEWKQADIKLNQRFEDFVYSDDGSFLTVSLYNGIYKSYDLDNWEKVFSSRASNEDFWSIGRDMKGNLYAGANNGHIYISTDYGLNWQHSAYGPGRIQRFFLGDDSVLYAGSYNAILRKEPDGKWMILKLDTVGGSYYSTFTDEENKLYTFTNSRIKRSDDTGKTWVKLDSDGFFNGGGRIEWIYDMIYTKERMIAACGDETGWFGVGYGVAVSDDKGMSWRWSNNGLPPKFPTAYRLKYSGDDTYLGTNAAGVFKSTDFGESWFAVNNGINAAQTRSVITDKDGVLFAASYSAGLSRSTDSGKNWEIVTDGLNAINFYSVISDTNGNLLTGSDYGTFRSSDKGDEWERIPSPGDDIVYHFRIDRQNRIYALTFGSGIYRTTDLGSSWIRLDKNFVSGYLFGFAVDTEDNIYVGGRGARLYKSTDEGESWTEAYISPVSSAVISDISISPDGNIFASSINEGILRSTDRGKSWEVKHNGIPTTKIRPVAVNSRGEVFTATYDEGIYMSDDDGENWTDITDNMNLVQVRSIFIDDNDNLYLATDESVWRSNPDSLTSITKDENLTPKEYSLSQNFPNPFNPTTKLSYSIAKEEHVVLKIYDCLGREVRTLVNEVRQPGVYRVDFNAEQLSSGVYFYRITAGKYSEVKKMQLVK